MTQLHIFPDDDPAQCQSMTDLVMIQSALNEINIHLERWPAHAELATDSAPETVMAAYADEIERLNTEHQFQSVDVIGLTADHPDKATLRDKFLHEHTHEDFEIRFFVEGSGVFYIHHGQQVFALVCERDDLISVPPNTTHWFDMGPQPHFKAIRFFTTDEGWVGHFTGDKIADRFPKFDQL